MIVSSMLAREQTKTDRETNPKERFSFISGPAAEPAKEVYTERARNFFNEIFAKLIFNNPDLFHFISD